MVLSNRCTRVGMFVVLVAANGAWAQTSRAVARQGEKPARLAAQLRSDVERLAAMGPRHTGRPGALAAAEGWLAKQLKQIGRGVERQAYEVDGVTCANLIVEWRGTTRPEEIIVIGAHYDTARGTPGADDNASGVAAALAIARRLSKLEPARTLRVCMFVNEEPPHFCTPRMGSLVYAQRCQSRNERIVGMISLETIGYYCDAANCQKFPDGLAERYPSTGNFVALVGNIKSRAFLQSCAQRFRKGSTLPVETLAAPHGVSAAGFSDHWSFWVCGYPGIMVTDTAMFRNPHYHKRTDTPDRLDYDRMAQVVVGVEAILRDQLSQ